MSRNSSHCKNHMETLPVCFLKFHKSSLLALWQNGEASHLFHLTLRKAWSYTTSPNFLPVIEEHINLLAQT